MLSKLLISQEREARHRPNGCMLVYDVLLYMAGRLMSRRPILRSLIVSTKSHCKSIKRCWTICVFFTTLPLNILCGPNNWVDAAANWSVSECKIHFRIVRETMLSTFTSLTTLSLIHTVLSVSLTKLAGLQLFNNLTFLYFPYASLHNFSSI